jgi:hypothetical protein
LPQDAHVLTIPATLGYLIQGYDDANRYQAGNDYRYCYFYQG